MLDPLYSTGVSFFDKCKNTYSKPNYKLQVEQLLFLWNDRFCAGRGTNRRLREALRVRQRDNNCVRLIKDLEDLEYGTEI